MEFISGGLRIGLFAGGLAVCLLLEGFFPLREATQPKTKRALLNLSFAAVNVVIVRLAFFWIVLRVSDWVAANEAGLLYWLDLPRPAEVLLGLLLMPFHSQRPWRLSNGRVPLR